MIDPASTQVPSASTSSPRSSPTSAARVKASAFRVTRPSHCAPRGFRALVDGVRLARRLAQARRGVALLLAPGAVEGALAAAHRAVAVAVSRVVLEGALEKRRRVARPGRGRLPGRADGRGRRAHLRDGGRDPRRVGRLQARDPAEHVGLGRARPRGRDAAERRVDRVQVPLLAFEGGRHLPRPRVVDVAQPLEQAARARRSRP